MLAMSDKYGICEASIPGLADRAKVSISDCEKALAELLAPDPYSRTTDFDGRRIEKIDGGWQLLNHAKYRDKMSADDRREKDRIRQQKWRDAQKKKKENVTSDVTPHNGMSRESRHTDTDTKEDTEERRSESNLESSPSLVVTTTKAPKPKRGTRIPEPFLLTSKMRTWAAAKRPYVDITLETEKFCNHFRSVSGRTGTKLNWELTWNNWILNAKDTNNGNGTDKSSYRQQRADEARTSHQRESEIRERVERRKAELPRPALSAGSGQLPLVEPITDGRGACVESEFMDASLDGTYS